MAPAMGRSADPRRHAQSAAKAGRQQQRCAVEETESDEDAIEELAKRRRVQRQPEAAAVRVASGPPGSDAICWHFAGRGGPPSFFEGSGMMTWQFQVSACWVRTARCGTLRRPRVSASRRRRRRRLRPGPVHELLLVRARGPPRRPAPWAGQASGRWRRSRRRSRARRRAPRPRLS
ncbi:unnamed protein product [Prorocentrum cordatum]|uniref:Uncharacterized protein n=1 Tax=Prorocentrum cordatum TaxID=2364126 RepID=A0ABN9UCB8_9DINO|nr:unnamed protein product [Polarella glacialis]